MSEFAQEIFKVNLEDEMRRSYLDYAMSVIVGRALPDARDGLKPVHRRVLYAMRELGNDWNKPYKKSARVVGDVIGKYHPHGDTAVYDALVRMAQNFSMRYMLIDGQGNFGSVDGDAPAAMRYTEVRMAKIAHELQADLEKETVDFIDNYDGSESEPGVFPARYPNLLVNGSSGIAVGMATNIPPHNLTEILNATIALIDDPDADDETLLAHVPGPDFPTAGIINGAAGIRDAYLTGRGRVVMRARTHFEEDDRAGKAIIIVTELPYQVNKARLIERIAELVREKKIEGITELRDESDKDGMRIVMELRRGELPDVMLNNLYQQTQMQSVFGINMVAIVDGQPRTLGLRDILTVFLRHRREVVTRRTIFDLRKARERAHILEGLAVALANIDAMIALIKAAPTSNEARASLMAQSWDSGLVRVLLERADAAASRPESLAAEFGLQPDQSYRLSLEQAQAILEMRLNRLTGLEQEKIVEEYRGLLEKIIDLLDILRSETRLMQVIRDELVAIMNEYGDERRTEIIFDYEDLSIEDLIAEEDRVVTLSREGYIKTQSLTEYQSQRRGGRGKSSTRMKDEDVIEQMLVASTHAWVLMFTNLGRVYWRKVYQLPQGARGARGRPIVNILPLQEGERVNALLPVREFVDDHYIFFATATGQVKKTPLVDFSRPRQAGIIAIDLREDDRLIGAALTDGSRELMLFSDAGKSIRFAEADVRSMGRTAGGVRGIRMDESHRVVSLIVVGEGQVLTATEHGYGKRTPIDDFPLQGRGGQGVIAIQTSERNGALVGAALVQDDDEVILISDAGTLVRTQVSQISSVSRNTQGVILIRLSDDEKLVQLASVAVMSADSDTDREETAADEDSPNETE
ncbi:MAG: DNA gyrase subunit A [Halothiobacillus sp. 14-56-357]|jgi:DNA gyrase subunit A|uniref:DNA gyrase subunit A n=1 Tax=Halothiobacillus sp. 15-55-196 TaxID=1970382 RepID=UPI000BC6F0C3|nr:DNA gyrase subunit A [Halothiobacillus sp. 15-55-196]OZB37476.1 MAG: DNA gyrase subunit A [Halothiobacillus sp. 15-55-196]OZB57691.1 MAG: DNA gyrase subunit A [Halothiobacillus sp. 14-56-357]OZB79516.1 MAG: DNA gyrase subunit A [Halothiobacillus sp. 13-55-115]